MPFHPKSPSNGKEKKKNPGPIIHPSPGIIILSSFSQAINFIKSSPLLSKMTTQSSIPFSPFASNNVQEKPSFPFLDADQEKQEKDKSPVCHDRTKPKTKTRFARAHEMKKKRNPLIVCRFLFLCTLHTSMLSFVPRDNQTKDIRTSTHTHTHMNTHTRTHT